MEVSVRKTSVTCEKSSADPRFHGVKEARGESRFLYHVKKHLNKIVYKGSLMLPLGDKEELILVKTPFIKKRMHKDGHLVSDMQQYLRTKKPIKINGKKHHVALYNDHWAINGLNEDWNDGEAVIRMEVL